MQAAAVDTCPTEAFWAVIKPVIIYEDEHLVCINKPSGMLSVPGKMATVSENVVGMFDRVLLVCDDVVMHLIHDLIYDAYVLR